MRKEHAIQEEKLRKKNEKEHAIEDNTLTNMKKKQATEYKKK